MRSLFPRLLGALLACSTIVAVPASSFAEKGDCGQPLSTGSEPNTADVLAILKASVGQATCDAKPCVCDLNSDGQVTTTDALIALRYAVGLCVPVFDCALTCSCPPVDYLMPCTSARITSRAGSEIDSGWTGIAHDRSLIEGASITVRVLRRCSDDGSVCEHDEDCGSGSCVATCDCNLDKECEFTGPTHQRHCFNTLGECSTNADCPVGQPCVFPFGPPLPLSSGGTPVCVVSTFEGPITGTSNSGTGESHASVLLRSRVFLGIEISRPCPTCGSIDDAPVVGAEFTCNGGPNDGDACIVDAISREFGGVSFDCPPHVSDNVVGQGLAIRLSDITTGTSTKTAQVPCGNLSFKPNNPLTPGGTPKCIDRIAAGDPPCSSNADCRRCSGDITIACTSNAQCSGKGVCAEAPDQPVTCGHWCHCGFCDNDPELPCFDSADCPSGQACTMGTGPSGARNYPQQKPNDCGGADKFICGAKADEECATAIKGECSEQRYRNCTNNTVCIDNDAGTCIVTQRPCFESRITRSGTPSPLGTYCAFESKACTSNADCNTEADDFCALDSARPESIALFCTPATSSTSVNNVAGITGPGAVRFHGFVEVCRCGDNTIGCDETCDDGNTVRGDGCDDYCQDE